MTRKPRLDNPSFDVDRLIATGRLRQLHILLTLRHHTDPDPSGRARVDVAKMLTVAFDHLAVHYQGVKDAALTALIRLQKEALDFYDHVLGSRGQPDVARLEQLLRDMDDELKKLGRSAEDIAASLPPKPVSLETPTPTKAWDDPTTTLEETIAAYRQRYPKSPVTDEQLARRYRANQRFNPVTGSMAEPVRPLPRPEHVDLPTDPVRVKAWEDYQRGGSSPPCFPAGTLVHTPRGEVPIERVAIGDSVFAWNERAAEVTVRPVVQTHRNWTYELVSILTHRGVIDATRSHRFWAEDLDAWIAAGEVHAGTELRFRNGGTAKVMAAERVIALEPTYNLEVAEDHTYFVAEAGVLVHNQDDSAFRFRDNARQTRIYRILDADGNVVYIGQTVHGEVTNRLYEHINDPGSALYIARKPGSPPIQVDDPRNSYQIKQIVAGKWTNYEAAVWEQHFIDRNGGLDVLLNRQNAITLEKFIQYRNLHNPC